MSSMDQVSEFHVDALLCDSVGSAEGKLYVQGGGWTMLTVPQLPAVLPRLGIGAVITVPYNRTNENHVVTVELKDEDGEPVLVGGPMPLGDPAGVPGQGQPVRADAQFTMGRPPMLQPGESQTIPFAINMDGVPVARPGGFVVDVSIDGTVLRTLKFRVLNAGTDLG